MTIPLPTPEDLARDAGQDYGLLITSDPATRTESRLAWIRRAVAAESQIRAMAAACSTSRVLVDAAAVRIEELAAERDRLLKQLPDGMKDCTIVFKECPKGHGWLTATNWVQHECPTCERDALRERCRRLEEALRESLRLLTLRLDLAEICDEEKVLQQQLAGLLAEGRG